MPLPDRSDGRDQRALAPAQSRALLALALGILVAFVNAKVSTSAAVSFIAGMVLSFLAFILATISVILEHIVPLALDPRAARACKACLCAGMAFLVGAILCYLHATSPKVVLVLATVVAAMGFGGLAMLLYMSRRSLHRAGTGQPQVDREEGAAMEMLPGRDVEAQSA